MFEICYDFMFKQINKYLNTVTFVLNFPFISSHCIRIGKHNIKGPDMVSKWVEQDFEVHCPPLKFVFVCTRLSEAKPKVSVASQPTAGARI